jgi:hypothetical protein
MSKAGGWFHCSVKPISRSAGRSVVAAAAYRCGECLHDELTDQIHDYTRRSGVEAAFIVAPEHAPQWAHDWGKLWNGAEAAEVKKNARTAREIELALPASVSAQEREKIVRKVAGFLVERYGVAVACALHEPGRHGDHRNYHAHILITTRRMEAGGLGKKTRELDDRKTGRQEITNIRFFAAAVINESLASAGSSERVDPRSNKERGIELIPSRHLGVEAAAMERKKKRSRLGDLNRDIEASNQKITALQKERAALDKAIEREREPKTPREQHYSQVREQLAVLRRPKAVKTIYRVSQGIAYENLRKRLIRKPIIEPPTNPLDPAPGSPYFLRLLRERQERESEISR